MYQPSNTSTEDLICFIGECGSNGLIKFLKIYQNGDI